MAQTLLLGGLLGVLIAAMYVFVGSRLTQRRVSAAAEPALQMFALWWFSLAGFQLTTSTTEIAAWAGITDVGLNAGVLYVSLLLLTVGIYGLVFYLFYLYTGNTRGFVGLTIAYLLAFLGILYQLTLAQPQAVAVNAWAVELVFAEPTSGPVTLVIVTALLVPPLLASLAYLSLYWRVDTTTQRYRVAVVGASLVLWMGGSFFVYLLGVDQAAIWPLVSKLIGLGGAIALFFAYFPPGWIQARGVEPLTEQTRLAAHPEDPQR